MRDIYDYLITYVDDRSYVFFRLSFSLLMIVYSVSKVTDESLPSNYQDIMFGYQYRLPIELNNVINRFPWYTTSSLYWSIHSPLMLVLAISMSFTYGYIAQLSFILFGLFKLVLTSQEQFNYNNHEYLYALVAFMIGLNGEIHYTSSYISISHISTNIPIITISILFLIIGLVYLMLLNSIYGIAGNIAVLGVGLIWASLVLFLSKWCYSSPKTIPRYKILLLQIFIVIIYFYAGLAKTDIDWLSGATMKQLLLRWTNPESTILRMINNIEMLQHYHSQIISIMAYGGLVLDLSAAFILLFFPDRSIIKLFYVLFLIFFHLLNHYLFIIETFPWVMISACSLFYSHWIDNITFHKISRNHDDKCIAHNSITKFVNYVCLLLAILLLLIHFLIPLSCGINTINDDGNINFCSSCQFFRWKMMTRSVRVISSTITLTNPSTHHSDMIHLVEWYNQIKLPHSSDIGVEMINVANYYEDKLWFYIQKIKHSAISTDSMHQISPYIYADIWLEINGPPAQRYVDPTVNIAESELKGYSILNTLTIDHILGKPAPFFDWVLPRITSYRGHLWSNYFQVLTKMAINDQLIINSTFKVHSSEQIHFLAETKPLWTTTMLPSVVSIIIIRGSIEVRINPSQVQLISEGGCVTAGTSITWRPSNSTDDNTVLLMLLTNNDDKRVSIFHNSHSTYRTEITICNAKQLPDLNHTSLPNKEL